MRHRFRRLVIRKSPAGVAVAPFEFTVLLGYVITSAKFLTDQIGHTNDILIKAIPFTGWHLTAWLVTLFVGGLTGCIGLILTGRRVPWTGLALERGGLILTGSAAVTYVAGIVQLIGFTLSNITLVTVAFQIVAIVYKVNQISQALASRPEDDR